MCGKMLASKLWFVKFCIWLVKKMTRPITRKSQAKPIWVQITFAPELKIALTYLYVLLLSLSMGITGWLYSSNKLLLFFHQFVYFGLKLWYKCWTKSKQHFWALNDDLWELWWPDGQYTGLQAERSEFKTWPGQCVVFLCNTLSSHSLPRSINGYWQIVREAWWNAGGYFVMDYHPFQGGVAIFLVASCYIENGLSSVWLGQQAQVQTLPLNNDLLQSVPTYVVTWYRRESSFIS